MKQFYETYKDYSKLSTALKEIHPSANQVFKDKYIFDFLALLKPFSEKNLRKDIL